MGMKVGEKLENLPIKIASSVQPYTDYCRHAIKLLINLRIRIDVGVAIFLEITDEFSKTGNSLLSRHASKVITFSSSILKLLVSVKNSMFCKIRMIKFEYLKSFKSQRTHLATRAPF
jgi:hypothetical protein